MRSGNHTGNRRKSIEWEFDGQCIRCTSHHHLPTGYVFIRRKGFSTRSLHRIVALRRHGKHECSRHTCDNSWCINPDHIVAGTVADNNRDRKERGRNPDIRGEKNPFSKLTNSDVIQIRALAGTLSHREIGKRFGVSEFPIFQIIHRRRWTHIP